MFAKISAWSILVALILALCKPDSLPGKEQKEPEPNRDAKPLTVIKTNVARNRTLSFTPDGKVLAGYDTDEGCIRFWESKNGKELPALPLVGRAGGPGDVAFSPDGTLLASMHYGTPQKDALFLWDWKNRSELARFDEIRLPGTIAFGPDGKYVGVVDLEHIYFFDVEKRKVAQKRVHRQGGICAGLAFSPDGKKAAVRSMMGKRLHIIDCQTGIEQKTLEDETGLEDGCFGWVHWKKDGKTLIVVGPGHGITLWNADSGKIIGNRSPT